MYIEILFKYWRIGLFVCTAMKCCVVFCSCCNYYPNSRLPGSVKYKCERTGILILQENSIRILEAIKIKEKTHEVIYILCCEATL